MQKSYRFGVIKYLSHAMRGEMLNVGLLIKTDGGFIVRRSNRLDKLKAISAAINPAEIDKDLHDLPNIIDNFGGCPFDDEVCRKRLSQLTNFQLIFQGSFEASTQNLAETCLKDLMTRYVEPEPALVKPVRKRATRLRNDIKSALKLEKILARPSEGLECHRVIYRHPLAQGVIADFVLQNGAMHVVESVDASSENISLQRCLYEIAMSTLTFEHARINWEKISVKPRLIYSASHELEKALSPSLYAAQHQGAEIINWESDVERVKFLSTLASLADSTDQQESSVSLFHASALPLRKIN
jgi:hypothetical protein